MRQQVFRYEGFRGRVGQSDLNGTLVYEVRACGRLPRPRLSGELVSNLLQFSISGADRRRRFEGEPGKRGEVS